MFRRIFLITWISYIGFYLCRKNFSVLMPYFKQDLGWTSDGLAHALFLYSLAYCIGQFTMGALADRFGSRLLVTVGMITTAACSALMAWIPNLALLQGINGVAQSTGWPGLLKLTRDWFPSANRGVVMGWWGTSLVVGGFAGTWLATWAAATHWTRGAWIPSLVMLVIMLAYVIGARDGKALPADHRPGPLVINAPLVAIAAMYFCVKLCRYAFLFWLPLFMTEQLRYTKSDAGYASTAFEAVGFFGVLAAGYASERFAGGGRFGVAALMLLALAILCIAYPTLSAAGPLVNLAAIAAIGIFTFGPDTLMAGAAVHDVAPVGATASAGGFVNGVGSLGQILSPYVVSILSTRFGWETLFPVLGGFAVLGAIALSTQLRPAWRTAT